MAAVLNYLSDFSYKAVCRHSNELYKPYNELNVVKVIKIGILWWLEQLFRMQELEPCMKLILLKPEGTRSVGKPKVSWLVSADEDLKNMGIGNWRR